MKTSPHWNLFELSINRTRVHVCFRSYHQYIQTADRDLGNGDLDAAEQNIADALKLIHGLLLNFCKYVVWY